MTNITENKGGIFINDDCLNYMKQIPDKSIDLVLTDPPYGKNCDKGTHGFGISKNRIYKGGWDNIIPSVNIFKEMKRISKNLIIFGYQYFAQILGNTNCLIVWDKTGNYGFTNNPFADFETAYTTFKNKTNKKYIIVQQGFIKDSKDLIIHPTQKPTELFSNILKDFSNNSDLVLDPFSGSGTTAIACHNLNRNFICIEKDKEYYEKSVIRYNKHIQQIKMFP